MLDYDYTKEYGLPMNESLRLMRIKKYPVQLSENMIVIDQLEFSGTIKVYENIGGTIQMPIGICDIECNRDVVQIAEIRVLVFKDGRYVQLDRLFCEYGYGDEIAPVLLEQVINFADFYNYKFRISDPLKKQKQPTFCRGRVIADILLKCKN